MRSIPPSIMSQLLRWGGDRGLRVVAGAVLVSRNDKILYPVIVLALAFLVFFAIATWTR